MALSTNAKTVNFKKAVNALARFNGLHTLNDLAGAMSLNQIRGEGGQVVNVPSANDIEKSLISLFIDTSEGAMSAAGLIDQVELLLNDSPDLRESFMNTFQVWYTKQYQSKISGEPSASENTTDILEMLGRSYGSGYNPINSTPSNPSKQSPGLSVILSNSHRVGLSQRDTNPSVLFFNSMPAVELARAVPFVDVQFFLGRPARNVETGQIQSLSLPRFLVGSRGTKTTSALGDMVLANEVPGNGNTVPGTPSYNDTSRSVAGMEMFCAPQTLVNANEIYDPTLRGVRILDPFKPLMSLLSFDISAVSSGHGLTAFKSGELSIRLHDRSRLAEMADFIRPDLYGLTEILIEYGWSHPDGESVAVPRNPYGDLINGLRLKEKYSIINSSFSMGDSGEVDIKLKIAMRGSEAMVTELISSNADGTGTAIREVQNLIETISELRRRVFGDGTAYATREIRGVQILDASEDALNNTTFGNDLREALREFRAGMGNTNNPSAQSLLQRLDELWGTVARRGGGNNNNSGNRGGQSETYMSRLRGSVQDAVREKMLALNSPDPFLKISSTDSGRKVQPNTNSRTNNEQAAIIRENTIQGITGGSTSLAKLILLFVGQPIALTNKFDDVQLVFYPFNSYAGKASNLNIGNFAIDKQFFADNFARWRLDRIGRSANVNLQDFIAFLGTTVIDDPAAVSYGLFEGDKSLFKRVITTEDGRVAESVEAMENPADHITAMERVLRDVTPDGSFRMPQIDFYLETTPEKVARDDGESADSTANEKTILRIHIFDRLATSYDTLGSLLANSRNTELAALGTVGQAPPMADGETNSSANAGVVESRSRIHNNFLSAAESAQIIEAVRGTGSTASATNSSNPIGKTEADRGPQMYRITGGSRAMKEFLLNTTPHINFGTIGTTIKTATLSSQQDAALSTVNLLRSFRRSQLEPNGENPGGLPLRVIPSELSMVSLGNPLLHFAQQFFIDFNTGTTVDNFYGIMGLDHKFTPGEFSTALRWAPLDAYGRYMGIADQARNAQAVLQDIQDSRREAGPTLSPEDEVAAGLSGTASNLGFF